MILHGRNLLVKKNGIVIAGCRSCVLSTNSDVTQVASKTSGKYKEYMQGKIGWTVRCGYFVFANTAFSLPLSAGGVFDISMVIPGDGTYGSNDISVYGTAILKKSETTATVGNLAQGSVEFQGSGPLLSSVNILPSLTSGWEGEEGASAIYSNNYGIKGPDGDLYTPIFTALRSTQLCFSVDASSGNQAPPDVTFCCYYGTDAIPYSSYLYDNGQTYTRQATGQVTINGQVRKYYTFTVLADCKMTIYMSSGVPIHCPQLEIGSTPTAFTPT